jgi:hypothetical protein
MKYKMIVYCNISECNYNSKEGRCGAEEINIDYVMTGGCNDGAYGNEAKLRYHQWRRGKNVGAI